ncbi:NtaA/DmoA family FMN-dependent monooxygenase [Dactylosporangium sp. NPDC051485]|uniref:NtaA/DmoA family FMN-dependent monooxygenase n=1 Tax=Dactylosporangium sp. NPDC051485 TaxID=3154846 RepID=UPI003449B48D
MSAPRKQVHLAAGFPGVNNTTVWSDPAAGSQIAFDSFRHVAQTAERGKFDFFFLAEGLRLREQGGKIYDLDIVGRPDTFTVLAALAAVTEHIGLTGTISSTFNEPYEVARQFASLDWLSGGRAAWNVVTSWDAFTGENFRRGGYLPQDQRYTRAKEFLQTAGELWDSWRGDEILADKASGQFLATPTPGAFAHADAQFDIRGQFNVPRSPQGRPVVLQAGESDEGREFAASSADVIFSRYSQYDEARAFYADVKHRLARYGRSRDDLLILPATGFVLGDTDAEAAELAREVRLAQVSPATTIKFLEQLWNTDLSDHDPDGPLPAFDPVVSDVDGSIAKGNAGARLLAKDPIGLANQWRAKATAEHLTSRELIIEVTARNIFVGSPATVAEEIDRFVQQDASDGFIIGAHVVPAGLDAFVDKVIPLLQERGVYRTEYAGTTLRDHLGLTPLAAPAAHPPIRISA